MKVKLLFFGSTADAVGSREMELAVDEDAAAGSLIPHLTQRYPILAKRELVMAVNEQYASADTHLKDGDEVAIFTAVSGG